MTSEPTNDITTGPAENVTLPEGDVSPEPTEGTAAKHLASTSIEPPEGLSEEMSEEDLRQLEKEREERLDPANRPRNAEVDNTKREWVNEKADFRDNLEGHPPEWDTSDGAGTERDPEIWQRLEEQTGKPTR